MLPADCMLLGLGIILHQAILPQAGEADKVQETLGTRKQSCSTSTALVEGMSCSFETLFNQPPHPHPLGTLVLNACCLKLC